MTSDEGSSRPPDPPASRWRTAARVLIVAVSFVAIAELGALVLSEYVGTSVFSWLLPGLLGAGCGELASSVSYPSRRAAPAPAVRTIVCAAGIAVPVVATVQAFRLADAPYGPAGRWFPPVVAALAGAVLMLLLPIPGSSTAGRARAASRTKPMERLGSGTDDDL